MGTGVRITTSKFSMAFGATLAGVIAASTASAQTSPIPLAPTFRCKEVIIPPGPNPDLPVLKPIFRSITGLAENDFDCLAWQDLIYLMWPAKPNERGVPDPNRKIGASGPTVWESYRTADTVFLPQGRDPGPWQQLQLMTTLESGLAQQVASGAVRNLTMTSKVSREVLSTILQNASAFPPPILNGISQAGGGTLYDLNGFPVYYEVAMDKVQYDYIHDHQLYNAYRQAVFARTNVISLPAGTVDVPLGAVEVKAAWKVLSDAERHSGRFHTIQALLGGAKSPVTVGLVGFHVFVVNGMQGAWATFAQMDNAPSGTPATSGTFNFFNPKCKLLGSDKPCPVNVQDANPGQVLQVTPDSNAATKLNTYMHYILQKDNAKTPWQFYNLIDVQWALDPKVISDLKAPVTVPPPLPNGTPNIPANNKDMLNPVLETFLQLPYPPPALVPLAPDNSCLGCHQYATTAAVGIQQPPYAASYSFMLGRASALPTDAP